MLERRSKPPFAVTMSGGCLAYGGMVLFEDLALSLPAGRWTCLLGPSGIGKTSLLRLMLGLERGNGGAGRVTCSDGGDLAGRAAYMAQRDLLLPWLTVLENVRLGERLRGDARTGQDRSDGRDRASALLDAVGLGTSAGARPDTLSGGMRQRAALARTLMEDRPVVLMDEPFSAVDAITRIRLQDLAARLLGGRTVLLVTHDPLEALRLGHVIHVLAGLPARLGAPIEPEPEVAPPRAVDDPVVLGLQGELLARLAAAHR
ncbi:MAG: ABC transporter ATP-binding protein [Rhodospirillales bacterium]|nr:ABC transporter ATP-binding protein [Rhodospirillales bacterium]